MFGPLQSDSGAAPAPFLRSFQHQVCLFMHLLCPTRAGTLGPAARFQEDGLHQVEPQARGEIRKGKTILWAEFNSVKSKTFQICMKHSETLI